MNALDAFVQVPTSPDSASIFPGSLAAPVAPSAGPEHLNSLIGMLRELMEPLEDIPDDALLFDAPADAAFSDTAFSETASPLTIPVAVAPQQIAQAIVHRMLNVPVHVPAAPAGPLSAVPTAILAATPKAEPQAAPQVASLAAAPAESEIEFEVKPFLTPNPEQEETVVPVEAVAIEVAAVEVEVAEAATKTVKSGKEFETIEFETVECETIHVEAGQYGLPTPPPPSVDALPLPVVEVPNEAVDQQIVPALLPAPELVSGPTEASSPAPMAVSQEAGQPASPAFSRFPVASESVHPVARPTKESPAPLAFGLKLTPETKQESFSSELAAPQQTTLRASQAVVEPSFRPGQMLDSTRMEKVEQPGVSVGGELAGHDPEDTSHPQSAPLSKSDAAPLPKAEASVNAKLPASGQRSEPERPRMEIGTERSEAETESEPKPEIKIAAKPAVNQTSDRAAREAEPTAPRSQPEHRSAPSFSAPAIPAAKSSAEASKGRADVIGALRASENIALSRPAPTPSAPAQTLAVRVANPDGAPVDIHVRQHRGEIQVAVRTVDTGLQTNLRTELNTLVDSLKDSGYRTETVIPRETAAQRVPAMSNVFEAVGVSAPSAGGQAQFSQQRESGEQPQQGGRQQQPQQQQNQQQQQQQRRAPWMRWQETLEQTNG